MSIYLKILSTMVFFTFNLPINAQVYTCEVNGKIMFTDQLCDYKEQDVEGYSNKASEKITPEFSGHKVESDSIAIPVDKVVYETSKRDEIALLELFEDKIVISQLIGRERFSEISTLSRPTYFTYKKTDYLLNDLLGFFWGKPKEFIPISIDGIPLNGFVLNGSKIIASGDYAKRALALVRKGKKLMIDRHYWGKNEKKEYVSFNLINLEFGRLEKYRPPFYDLLTKEDVRCRKVGARIIVWAETKLGSYALNGQALALEKNKRLSGEQWIDSYGNEIKIGRDKLDHKLLNSLIKIGVNRCN